MCKESSEFQGSKMIFKCYGCIHLEDSSFYSSLRSPKKEQVVYSFLEQSQCASCSRAAERTVCFQDIRREDAVLSSSQGTAL